MTEAKRLVLCSLRPAAADEIVSALAKLSSLVARRAESEADAELQLAAYTERLREYPADVVMAVLSQWPCGSQWWPTWYELRQLLEAAAKWRRGLLRQIEMLERWQSAAQLEGPMTFQEPEPTDEERASRAAKMKKLAAHIGADAKANDGVISIAERIAQRRRAADEQMAELQILAEQERR